MKDRRQSVADKSEENRDKRQMAANARAQKEADWFILHDLSDKDPVMLVELLRLKFLQFYATGGMDALDTVEERMSLKR